jgi:hypothetical protein
MGEWLVRPFTLWGSLQNWMVVVLVIVLISVLISLWLHR